MQENAPNISTYTARVKEQRLAVHGALSEPVSRGSLDCVEDLLLRGVYLWPTDRYQR